LALMLLRYILISACCPFLLFLRSCSCDPFLVCWLGWCDVFVVLLLARFHQNLTTKSMSSLLFFLHLFFSLPSSLPSSLVFLFFLFAGVSIWLDWLTSCAGFGPYF